MATESMVADGWPEGGGRGPGLNVRRAAALKLLRSGMETDGLLLLSYVVWPTPAAERSADWAASAEAQDESAAAAGVSS